MSSRVALIDERSQPSLRTVLGHLLARSTDAAFAIRRVRLAGLDLTAGELGPLRRCRVLVGRLDAAALHDMPHPGALAALRRLLAFAESGRLAVRVAPTLAWNPDFSVLQGFADSAGKSSTDFCVVGSHYFRDPDPPDGPALTTILTAPDAVALAQRRFDGLWTAGYDVLPAVMTAIEGLIGPG